MAKIWLFLAIGAVNNYIWNTILQTMMDIIFGDFLILYQIFFSRRVKRNVIISKKYRINEVPHELPNDLRPRILGNYNRLEKSQNFIEI